MSKQESYPGVSGDGCNHTKLKVDRETIEKSADLFKASDPKKIEEHRREVLETPLP